MTIKQHIDAAIKQAEDLRLGSLSSAAREFSLAITALEDAQMRATRGLAKTQGKFAPADLQEQN